MYTTKLPEKLNVGILAASSLGAELTQQNLDAFHSVGNTSELLISGSQRIEECLNNSSTLKKIIYKVKKPKSDLTNLVFTNFGKIISSIEYLENFNNIKWLKIWNENFPNIQKKDVFVYFKITISVEKQINSNFMIQNWNFVSKEFLDPNLVAFSPYMIDGDDNLYNEVILSFNYNLEFNKKMFLQLNYLSKSDEDILKFMIEMIYKKKILNFKLYGIENIEEIVSKDLNYSLIICNPNSTLRQLIHIDPYNIVINKTNEMTNIYGIEVSRKCLIDELSEIMPKILKCHIIVLVSFMTLKGTIRSINRYSNRTSKDWLKRVGFEEPLRNIIQAAINNETDYLETITSKIITSKLFLQ